MPKKNLPGLSLVPALAVLAALILTFTPAAQATEPAMDVGDTYEIAEYIRGEGLVAPAGGGARLDLRRDVPPQVLLAQAIEEEDVNDPLEPMNRAIFGFNNAVYDFLLTPLADAYNTVVPETPREAVSNLLDNWQSPVVFANDLLQLEFRRALETLTRFVINTTLGMGGINDAAGGLGLERHDEDFGQTLGAWGVGEGFYLVLPLLGPSNPRDALGIVADSYLHPAGYYFDNVDKEDIGLGITIGSGFVEYAGIVDDLEQVRKTSVDYYAAVRSLYRQRRKTEISNGSNVDLPPIPDLDLNFDFDPQETAPSVAGVGESK